MIKKGGGDGANRKYKRLAVGYKRRYQGTD